LREAAFVQWLVDGGQVVVPVRLLQKLQILNIPPEKLGYLILALARNQEELTPEQKAKDRWLNLALTEGWAAWEGEGEQKKVVFTPLWDRLNYAWQQTLLANPESEKQSCKNDFDYAKIVKWLDKVRGCISATPQDKRYLQEFNLKFGWSTDFIIAFLELFFEKTNNRSHNYYYLAQKVYSNGIDTVGDLIRFMNEQDWTAYKVEEIKQYIGKGPVTLGEKELYLKWQNQWKLSHELILKGAQSLTRTNRPSFNYLDKILEDWWQQGIKDPQEAEKALQSFAGGKAGKTRRSSGKRRVAPPGNRDLNKILGID